MPKSSSLKETKKALRAGTVGKQNGVLGQIRGWLGRLCNQAITGPRTNINSNFTDLETKMHVGFRQNLKDVAYKLWLLCGMVREVCRRSSAHGPVQFG